MKCLYSDSIPKDTKFVAIYSDGSGAALFVITKDGDLLNHDGEKLDVSPQSWLPEAGYLYWIALPPSFKLWYEHEI